MTCSFALVTIERGKEVGMGVYALFERHFAVAGRVATVPQSMRLGVEAVREV